MILSRIVRVLVAGVGAAAAVTAVATPAGAAPAGLHPAPLCGAFNMVESSPAFYEYAVSGGMDVAMSRDAGQGNDGMFGAVAASSGAHSPACTGS